jgi:hypothetical protein
VWESKNGVLCVKGPISPTLFKRAGTVGDNGWEWKMVDGQEIAYTETSGSAENTISVELRNEENRRVRIRNLKESKKEQEMAFDIEELEEWTMDKRLTAESVAEQKDLESGDRRNLLLESAQSKPKIAYRKEVDSVMSPDTDFSELERNQEKMQEEQTKTENEMMIEEVNTKVPMKRSRADPMDVDEEKKPDTYNQLPCQK